MDPRAPAQHELPLPDLREGQLFLFTPGWAGAGGHTPRYRPSGELASSKAAPRVALGRERLYGRYHVSPVALDHVEPKLLADPLHGVILLQNVGRNPVQPLGLPHLHEAAQ